MSVSDGRIITTSQPANFSLFWVEVDDWEESFVDFNLGSGYLIFGSEQLVTVRYPETER